MIDERFLQKISDLEKTVDALSRSRQPQLINWFELNPSPFAYVNSDTISCTGLDPTVFINVGDRLKITQTTDKYFYVKSITSTQIRITPGSLYTLANAPITKIYVSNLSSPAGMGASLPYTPTLAGMNYAATFDYVDASFSMNGKIVKMSINCGINTNNNEQYLNVGLPITPLFDHTIAYPDKAIPIYERGTSSVWVAYQIPAVDEKIISVSKAVMGTNFGVPFVYFDFVFEYPVTNV